MKELEEPSEIISYLLMTTRSQVLIGSSPYTIALRETLELSGYQDLLLQPIDIDLTGTFSVSGLSEDYTISFSWMEEDICLAISRRPGVGQQEQRTSPATTMDPFTFWKPVICLIGAMIFGLLVVLMSNLKG